MIHIVYLIEYLSEIPCFQAQFIRVIKFKRPKKKDKSKDLSFLFVFVSLGTQHRLTACGQHHFEQSENIIVRLRTQNDVAFGK